jgi:hypothetical protein
MYVYQMKPGRGFNPVMQLLSEWRDRRDRPLLTGARKVDEARKEGENLGYDRGVADALAVLANEMRVQMYDKWEMIPILSGDNILTQVMRPSLEKLVELEDTVGDLGTPAEIRERRNEALSQWLVYSAELLDKAALPEDMEKRETERHRQAVLDKTEEPTDEDREWLLAKLAEVKEQWAELKQYLPEDIVKSD